MVKSLIDLISTPLVEPACVSAYKISVGVQQRTLEDSPTKAGHAKGIYSHDGITCSSFGTDSVSVVGCSRIGPRWSERGKSPGNTR